MVNEKIFDLAGQLQDVVKEQMQIAQNAISSLPEGQAKKDLKALLSKASTGKVKYEDAQKEIQKIINNGF